MNGFDTGPDPDHPGWSRWNLREPGRFNDLLGPLIARRDPDGRGRLRMLLPEHRHSNLLDAVHGGVLLAVADVALFAGPRLAGLDGVDRAQTIECGIQFVGRAQIGMPLDAVTEVLRETGRLIFLRGVIEQAGGLVASFHGTIRKASPPRP